jgi:hypothetical protein
MGHGHVEILTRMDAVTVPAVRHVSTMITDLIYRLCIWALKKDFGEDCTGEEPLCVGCRVYNARKTLEEIIGLN